MKFRIKHRWTDAVQFECELSAEVAAGASYRAQLGFAAKRAVEAGANLTGANLAGAYLTGANLAGAKWRNGVTLTRAPLYIHGLAYPVVVLDHHMQIGCELHALADWAAFDNERIARMDGVRARRFWQTHRDALLALAASDGRAAALAAPGAE